MAGGVETAMRASMRPEDFSPGGALPDRCHRHCHAQASMRPEDFSPGGMDGSSLHGAEAEFKLQ